MRILRQTGLSIALFALVLALLAGCSSTPLTPSAPKPPTPSSGDSGPLPPPITRSQSLWTAVHWADLPGWPDVQWAQAWSAWLRNCERPTAAFRALCEASNVVSFQEGAAQRAWMMAHLQPYQLSTLAGASYTQGLLTGYYEPVVRASRRPNANFRTPLYRLPADFASRRPWYSRQEADTLPQAQAALAGREIAYLADPIDALILQIQGSGRLEITEPDGSTRLVRLAFAGTNQQPYRSVARWLSDRAGQRDSSWPAIKAWAAQHPNQVQAMLWSNPRLVFFQEQAITAADADQGPRGAAGLPLTPQRSIAVDPGSIPYGTPVWLVSSGPAANLQKMVFAQDTGSAITGAVRADFFTGSGPQAGDLAGRLKQPLQLWVLWPKMQ